MTDHTHPQWDYSQILELHAHGYSTRQIADKLGNIDHSTVAKILKELNQICARELKDFTYNNIPLQYASSVILLRSIMTKCEQIEKASNDHRVKLNALSIAKDCNSDISMLMSDAGKVYKAILQHDSKLGKRRQTDNDGNDVGSDVGVGVGEQTDGQSRHVLQNVTTSLRNDDGQTEEVR